ncbi:MAG: outer membrane protein transport protein [Candidatus Zixiibacteriota bacterium]
MKTLVSVFALVILLSFTSFAMGQESYYSTYPAMTELSYGYYGGGSRAFAMGSANIGIADDVNGGAWNPAGIWVIESPTVSASYSMFNPDGDFTLDRSFGIKRSFGTTNKIDMSAIGHFSFVTPVRIKGHPFVFTFNYVRNNERTEESVVDDDDSFNDSQDKSFLRTYALGFSTRIYKQLSFGALANIYDGRRIKNAISSTSRDTSILVNSTYITQELAETATALDSVSANGFNFTLGLLYKFEKFSIGASVHTPFDMKNDNDRSEFEVTTIGGLPSINNSDTTYIQDLKTKTGMPLSLGFGVGFYPNEKLTFAVDANYQKYGSVDYYYLDSTFISPGGDRFDFFETIPIDWNNTFSFGGGAEYKLTTGFGQIPLRAGVRYNQLPKPEKFTVDTYALYDDDDVYTGVNNVDFTAQDRQSEVWITLGTGIHWEQLGFDISYRIVSGQKETTEHNYYNSFESDGSVVSTGQSTEVVEGKANEFYISFTGRF